MTEIIGVRFKSGGKQYYFDPQGTPVDPRSEEHTSELQSP